VSASAIWLQPRFEECTFRECCLIQFAMPASDRFATPSMPEPSGRTPPPPAGLQLLTQRSPDRAAASHRASTGPIVPLRCCGDRSASYRRDQAVAADTHVARIDLLNVISTDVAMTPHIRLQSAMRCQVMLPLLLLNEDLLAASPEHREWLGRRWRAGRPCGTSRIASGAVRPRSGSWAATEEPTAELLTAPLGSI
jgi:hypothetical protein